jgi:hypothetical protein
LSLEQVSKAQRGSRCIAILFFNLCARWGLVVNATSLPFYIQKRDAVTIVQEAGWAPGPVRTGKEKLAPPAVDPWAV